MTPFQARKRLDVLNDLGFGEVRVTPEIFNAYKSDLPLFDRYSHSDQLREPSLMYKSMVVKLPSSQL